MWPTDNLPQNQRSSWMSSCDLQEPEAEWRPYAVNNNVSVSLWWCKFLVTVTFSFRYKRMGQISPVWLNAYHPEPASGCQYLTFDSTTISTITTSRLSLEIGVSVSPVNNFRKVYHYLASYWCWILLLLVWHAPLGVHSAKRRHQSPEWTILSHSYRLIQGEIVWSQVLLDSLHPCSTRMSWWSPPVLRREAVMILNWMNSNDCWKYIC